MTCGSLFLLGLIAVSDGPKPDTPEDRARRAAIVDRIMAEPAPPRARPAAPQVVQAPMVIEVFERRGRVQKSITLEQPAAAPLAADEAEDEAPPPPMPRRLNLNDAVLGRENFDRWIFDDDFDEKGRQLRLQTLLAEKINRAMQDQNINPTQLRKLRLAGSGDIKRFFDRVEDRRQDFELARKKYQTGRLALQQLEPLSLEFQVGPFGEDSLFSKMLKKIESETQAISKTSR